MNSANPITQHSIFTANAQDIIAFLSVAIDSITGAKHELTASEKSGFHLCMAAFMQNVHFAHEADMEIWEMEGGNA